jgi:hypothetical protein
MRALRCWIWWFVGIWGFGGRGGRSEEMRRGERGSGRRDRDGGNTCQEQVYG